MVKYKLRTLKKIGNYLSNEKARLLATAFIVKLYCQKYKKFTLGHRKWFTIHMRNLIMNCLF